MASVNIEDKLYNEIKEYCALNGLKIGQFINDMLRNKFMVEKYDDAPPFFKKKEATSEKDVVIVQEIVPVEKSPKKEEAVEEEPVKENVEEVQPATEPEEKPISKKEAARKRVQFL